MGARCGELGEAGCGQRHDDEQHERLGERGEIDALHELRSDEQPQLQRKQQHLRDHEQRCGREQPVLRAAGDARERDHVVDARRQQHEEHADQQHPVVRDDPGERPDDDRHDDEVQDQDGREEAPVAQRLPHARERHAEERRVQQDTERRSDGELRRTGEGGREKAGAGAHRERGDVQQHLMPLHPLDARPHRTILAAEARTATTLER